MLPMGQGTGGGVGGEFQVPERFVVETVKRTGRKYHLPHPGGLIQDSVMPGCKGPGSQQPLGKGFKTVETEMGQSQSWNTNTSIFYVHECEKKERPTETEQAMGAQTSLVSF